MTDNMLITIVLGVLILFISMSIGKLLLAYRNDYQPIASLFKAENSQGFNAVFRIAIAPMSIVTASIVLYLLHGNSLTRNIWLAAAWYFLFQTVFIISWQKWQLVSKTKYFLFHIASISLSYYLYTHLIVKGVEHLLPDEANLRTDIWLLFAAFAYGIFHSIPENYKKFNARKTKYVLSRTKLFRAKYSQSLQPLDQLFQNIILSIMIYEDFNRPKIVRFVERLRHAKTQGIMQVAGAINDEESIDQTIQAISSSYNLLKTLPRNVQNDFRFSEKLREIFASHNPHDTSYPHEVSTIFEVIEEKYPS